MASRQPFFCFICHISHLLRRANCCNNRRFLVAKPTIAPPHPLRCMETGKMPGNLVAKPTSAPPRPLRRLETGKMPENQVAKPTTAFPHPLRCASCCNNHRIPDREAYRSISTSASLHGNSQNVVKHGSEAYIRGFWYASRVEGRHIGGENGSEARQKHLIWASP